MRIFLGLMATAFAVHVFVIPQIGGARAALHTVSAMSPVMLAGAFVLEVASIVAYGALTRAVLPAEHQPGLAICAGVSLASMGVSHVVPGGAGTTAAVNYRLFGLAGVPRPDLAYALVTQAAGSAVVLNLIFWVALVVSIPTHGFEPISASAAGAGAVLLIVVTIALVGLLRGEARLASGVARLVARVFRRDAGGVEQAMHRSVDQLRQLLSDRRRMWRATAAATANWMLDAAALWVCVAAFGHRPDVVDVLVAYCVANVVAAIPITPSGLGFVEATLIPLLVAFGTPASVAAVAVVAYRLISFWLPIPAGAVAYLVVERRLATATARGVLPVIEDLLAARDTKDLPAARRHRRRGPRRKGWALPARGVHRDDPHPRPFGASRAATTTQHCARRDRHQPGSAGMQQQRHPRRDINLDHVAQRTHHDRPDAE